MSGGEVRLPGQPISPGIGIGRAVVEEPPEPISRRRIMRSAVRGNLERFRAALATARGNLARHIRTAHHVLDEDLHRILQAHELMLDDQEFASSVEQAIEQELKNPGWAIGDEVQRLVARLQRTRDPYLQARAEDIRDLGHVLLEALSDARREEPAASSPGGDAVMVTRNLYPSQVLKAHGEGVVGFATESQATSSHAAILLKGLGVPVVGAVENLCAVARAGDELVVDALEGAVVVRPRSSTRRRYERRIEELKRRPAGPAAAVPATTRDGVTVRLLANIEHPSHVPLALRSGLEGIGLFRTEFMALERGFVPDEEEQVGVYQQVIQALEGRPVVIRTLDIGADKATAELHRCTGLNPALGVRGIRRHLVREPAELLTQLRGILRAAAVAPVPAAVGILFPMIAHRRDLRGALEYLQLARGQLRKSRTPHASSVRVGAMIELPAAAIAAGEILAEVDFISVGTNDLLQYFMGADRDNPDVLSYYDPADPAFLWLLRHVVSEAARIGRAQDVTVCGEIAGDPEMVPRLLEAGFRSLSVSPLAAEEVRQAIGRLSLSPSAGRRSR